MFMPRNYYAPTKMILCGFRIKLNEWLIAITTSGSQVFDSADKVTF